MKKKKKRGKTTTVGKKVFPSREDHSLPRGKKADIFLVKLIENVRVCLRGFPGCPPARSDPTYDGKKLCGSFRFLCKRGRKTAENFAFDGEDGRSGGLEKGILHSGQQIGLSRTNQSPRVRAFFSFCCR